MAGIFAVLIALAESFIDIFAVVAGITLWRGTSFGRKASIAVQAIQLPKIISPALIFMFTFGFDFWLHASSSAFGFQTAFFGNNQIFIGVGVQDVPVDLGVSVTAIIALVILKKYKPAVRTSLRPSPPLPPSEWPASGEAAPYNKSLDASGGSVNCKDEGGRMNYRAAASTQPLSRRRSKGKHGSLSRGLNAFAFGARLGADETCAVGRRANKSLNRSGFSGSLIAGLGRLPRCFPPGNSTVRAHRGVRTGSGSDPIKA